MVDQPIAALARELGPGGLPNLPGLHAWCFHVFAYVFNVLQFAMNPLSTCCIFIVSFVSHMNAVRVHQAVEAQLFFKV